MTAFDPDIITEYLDDVDKDYLYELSCLQVELLELQREVMATQRRVAVLVEGRDAAGKGGAILRFTQHLNTRHVRAVALPKPTEAEKGQWSFLRYLKHLPDPGEIVFFDRSWYTRAVVEPVMGFCTDAQYERFMEQVVPLEKMLCDDGVVLLKLWFSIDSREQAARLEARKHNPLKAWKISPVDLVALDHFEDFSRYKTAMFARTASEHAPWHVIDGNDKKRARLEAIRLLLSAVPYAARGLTGQRTTPDPAVVRRRTGA
jgi:polyphosphate kinase 2